MKKCTIGGQAVMEGVMMKSPQGIAMAVRREDGSIVKEFKPYQSKAKKGTFLGFPIVRGVVAFVESLQVGMKTIARSAELAGIEMDEEPTRFEKWLSKVFGKSVEKIVIGIAVALALVMSVGLFMLLPTLAADLIFGPEVSSAWKSLTAGGARLLIFLGYIVLVSQMKDIKRVFMYHGAEHKTIACYEADEELTPENARKHKRLHPRCGTNYLFLVMAVSILFFSAVGWSDNKLILFGSRIVLLPVVGGLLLRVLQLAAKYDNILTKIVRAPGMALQLITTKEPTDDMLEVAIASFNVAMDPQILVRESEEAAAKAQADKAAEAGEGDENAPAPAAETAVCGGNA